MSPKTFLEKAVVRSRWLDDQDECPICGSADIEGDGLDDGGGRVDSVWELVECRTCGSSWRAVYALHDVVTVEAGAGSGVVVNDPDRNAEAVLSSARKMLRRLGKHQFCIAEREALEDLEKAVRTADGERPIDTRSWFDTPMRQRTKEAESEKKKAEPEDASVDRLAAAISLCYDMLNSGRLPDHLKAFVMGVRDYAMGRGKITEKQWDALQRVKTRMMMDYAWDEDIWEGCDPNNW